MCEFYRYFKENMEALGLPAPESLFGSLQAAIGTSSAILMHIDKFGKNVTIGELIRAGTKLEVLAPMSACTAGFYVGAAIGSIAVATGRCLGRGTSLSDVLATSHRYGLDRPWLHPTLHRCHAVYDADAPSRDLTRSRMMTMTA